MLQVLSVLWLNFGLMVSQVLRCVICDLEGEGAVIPA